MDSLELSDLEKSAKKKDKKKKEKGYIMFEEDSDSDILVGSSEKKSEQKGSKHERTKPSFRFPKLPPKEFKEQARKSIGKEERERKDKQRSETKIKQEHADTSSKPVFGVSLVKAVKYSSLEDNLPLPAVFRDCIEYIEDNGITCENIYRVSGVKSKVQKLRDKYNKAPKRREPSIGPLYELSPEPHVAASLLKLYLRELPESVVPKDTSARFDDALQIRDQTELKHRLHILISDLPEPNRYMLSWLIVHMKHVIQNSQSNHMDLRNVMIVLSPTLKINHRIIGALLKYCDDLFPSLQIVRTHQATAQTTSPVALTDMDSLQTANDILTELSKHESALSLLHNEVYHGKSDSAKEEQLWELQRLVTQLKRKLKKMQKVGDKSSTVQQPTAQSTSSSQNTTPVHKPNAVATTPARESQLESTPSSAGVVKTTEIEVHKQEDVLDPEAVNIHVEERENSSSTPTPGDEIDTSTENKSSEEQKYRGELLEMIQMMKQKQREVSAEGQNQQKQQQIHFSAGDAESDHVTHFTKEENNKVSNAQHRSLSLSVSAASKTSSLSAADSQKIETDNDVFVETAKQKLSTRRHSFSNVSTPSTDVEAMAPFIIPLEELEDVVCDSDESRKLLDELISLHYTYDELMQTGNVLRHKVSSERREIDRLKVKINNLRSQFPDQNQTLSSNEEDNCQDIDQLKAIFDKLSRDHEIIKRKNAELRKKLFEERQLFTKAKVAIRLTQFRQNQEYDT